MKYNTEKEVLECVASLRRDHSSLRADVASRIALGLAYSNGRHWTAINSDSLGARFVDTWAEDWDPRSSELRVVDNRTGPLVRRIAADTNATSIEAAVTPPPHTRTFEVSDQANVSQAVLNALSSDLGMSRHARNASSLRWQGGSSILFVTLAKKRRLLPVSVALDGEGHPIEIDDHWLTWGHCPLCDIVWDPANHHADLEDHGTLLHERVLTEKEFRQEFGDPATWGLDPTGWPTLSDLAPYYVQAAKLSGTTYFQSFARRSDQKGIRIVTLYAADDDDRTRWPLRFLLFDLSPTSSFSEGVEGRVLNFDSPESPFGHHQRPLFKLDAFRRDDAVLAWGAPHVLMSDQDRLNILRSVQMQGIINVVQGMWLLDERTADRDQFVNDLAMGVGGVLRWNSRDGTLKPPQFVTPPPPSPEFTIQASDAAISMRGQLHLTDANLGMGKTHIPQAVTARLLSEGNSVIDNIILRDVDVYSDALKLTLGTVRRVCAQPNRMLARLRDRHGFSVDDLEVLLTLDPYNNPLSVRVRQHSVITRSIAERTQQLNESVAMGGITPKQAVIAMSEELERPVLRSHDLQIRFCQNAVRQTIAGAEWPGLPNLDTDIFVHVAEQAMWGLDLQRPEDRAAMRRLQEAILIQKQLALENQLPMMALDPATGGPLQSSAQGPSSGSLDRRGGPPASISPTNSPVGASGGLRQGLPPSTG